MCDLSPRAVWRLGRLGFGSVYDYPACRSDDLVGGVGARHEESLVVTNDHHRIALGRVHPHRIDVVDATWSRK